jgi:hypothetical protein
MGASSRIEITAIHCIGAHGQISSSGSKESNAIMGSSLCERTFARLALAFFGMSDTSLSAPDKGQVCCQNMWQRIQNESGIFHPSVLAAPAAWLSRPILTQLRFSGCTPRSMRMKLAVKISSSHACPRKLGIVLLSYCKWAWTTTELYVNLSSFMQRVHATIDRDHTQ